MGTRKKSGDEMNGVCTPILFQLNQIIPNSDYLVAIRTSVSELTDFRANEIEIPNNYKLVEVLRDQNKYSRHFCQIPKYTRSESGWSRRSRRPREDSPIELKSKSTTWADAAIASPIALASLGHIWNSAQIISTKTSNARGQQN